MLFLSFDLVKSLVYMYSVYVCNSKLNPAVNMVNVPQLPARYKKIYTDPW